MRKIVSVALAAMLSVSMLAGCGTDEADNGKNNGSNTEQPAKNVGDASKGKVYYLNFKPEVADVWKDLATKFTEETGIEAKVVTAAAGTYESTLTSEIVKSEAPTLFQINGPIGYQNWKDYCADLSGTNLYDWMVDKSLAISEGDGVYGIPYVVEGYGIIYNDEIMKKYFALEDKAVDISSTKDIKSYDTLKSVVEDMTKNKDKLGIDGVFASTSLKSGEDWRWQSHLANLPIYYELKDKNVEDLAEIDFTYAEQYKNIFDLYINNSVTDPKLLGSKSVEDSMSEFALGKAAMVQNGNWGWGQVADVSGNKVKEEEVKFLPIYFGLEGEENQNLCLGTENYICVNSQASADDQAASIKFFEWVYSSEVGKKAVTEELGFITAFNTFEESEQPNDPLAKEVISAIANTDLEKISWNFTIFPSQNFKNNFGAKLLEYVQGQVTFDDVKSHVISSWKEEKAAIAE